MNFENLTETEKIFYNAAKKSGLPTDSETLKADFQTMADDAKLEIANPSKFSAFWVFVSTAATTPLLWLSAFVVRRLMPQTFVFTATGAFLDLHTIAHGLERRPAAFAEGTLSFSRPESSGRLVIPAGTRVRTAPINGTVYRVSVIEDTEISDGALSANVHVKAEVPGASSNLGAGYYCLLDSDLPGITAVTHTADWLTHPGTDEETDESLRLRIRNIFLAAGLWYTDARYKAIISAAADIEVERIYIQNTGEIVPGSAKIYILFDSGAASEDTLANVNDLIMNQGNHGHGDDVKIFAFPETSVNLSTTLYFKPETGNEQIPNIQKRVADIIKCAFRQNRDFPTVGQVFPFSRFALSGLSSDIHRLCPEVSAVIFDKWEIIADLEIPRLKTLTVIKGGAA